MLMGYYKQKIPRHRELKSGVQQRNTDIVGWYEQSCAKSSFFAFSSGEINWETKQKERKMKKKRQKPRVITELLLCFILRIVNMFSTSQLKEHGMSDMPFFFLADMGMLLLCPKEFGGETGVESRGDCGSNDRKGKGWQWPTATPHGGDDLAPDWKSHGGLV